MLTFGVFVLGGVIGFGLGRIKNAGKIAAAKAEIAKVEGTVSAEAAKIIAAIKAKL